MAKIEYVGKKDLKTDNVAGTSTEWHGPGDIQVVEDPTAVAKLIGHPNIWRLAKGEKAVKALVEKEIDPEVAKAAKLAKLKAKEVDDEEAERDRERVAARVDITTMPKDKLIAHAKRTYGLDLDGGKKVEVLRDAVARVAGKDATGARNTRK